MEQLALEAKARQKSTKGAMGRIRKLGRVPGIVYGLKGEPEMVDLSEADLRPIFAHRNAVININIDGKAQKVMLKSVDREPFLRRPVHIDFIRVDDSHPVSVLVPVVTEGNPIGVKTQGGIFATMRKTVKLRAKVQDIPEEFKIDIAEMNAGTIFYVRDLKFDKGIFLTPAKTALFGVTTTRKEEAVASGPGTATPAAAKAPAAGAKAPAAGAKAPAAGAKAPAAGAKAPAAKAPAAKK